VLTREELEATDTAEYAIEALAGSSVREVVILGRRGPAQAAFTNPEVRELGELVDADVIVDPADCEADELTREFLESDAADATNRKNHESFSEFASREPEGKRKRVVLRFLRSPVAIGGDGKVEWIDVAVNELHADESGAIRAGTTDESERIECGMVLRSIGYLGTGIEGVPHDPRGGVIPNDRGRVTGDDGEPIPGQYVVGWIKRGPSGVIGTNKKDASETIELLLEDAEAGRVPDVASDRGSLPLLLSERGLDYVEFDGWRAIDELEKSRGEPLGRPRVKLTDFESMIHASKGGAS
jgi:ferredoxin--NADP+ reductase